MAERAVALVVPAFNEEDTICKVVANAKPYGDVIVVNDGSSDQTSMRATLAGAYVLEHPKNLGYESAINTGFVCAVDRGYDYVITLDADGQHNPSLVRHFVRELDSGADLVVGRRTHLQRWSEMVFSLTARALWGIGDPLCGMKGYRISVVREPRVFDTTKLVGTELMVRMIRQKVSVTEVPIVTISRGGASRFGEGLTINLRILKALLKVVFCVK